MRITVTYQRSDDWLRAKREETGEQIGGTGEIEVLASDLSKEVRRLLLDYNQGDYPTAVGPIYYDSEHMPCRNHYSCYGSEPIKINTDNPEQAKGLVNSAILSTFAGIRYTKERREAEAEERRQAEEAKKAKEQEARKILAKELETGENNTRDLETLAWFLSKVPQDALRGTVKRVAEDGTAKQREAIKAKVEKASPYVIFEDDDEEEV